jgi:hypothetical protein
VRSLGVDTRNRGALPAGEEVKSLIVQVVEGDTNGVGGKGRVWTDCVVSDEIICTTGEGMVDD